jgi:membrane-bound lytic murein transglycosylase D
MPTELALLPFIESAFNPNALSSANAAGMWQFVPGTGRDFNLKQDAFKDERRGILASTDAALTYLQRLYDMFGDWQLALAAYNWGEGSVQKAIKRNQAAGKPTDFESLADNDAGRNPQLRAQAAGGQEHRGQPAAVRPEPAGHRQQALLHRRRQDQRYRPDRGGPSGRAVGGRIQGPEPAFKRPVITGDEQTKILLPKENAEKFHLNLAQWTKELSTWTTHKITSARESIGSLASRFHTRLK